MAAYIVFIRESTRNASELETYSQEVGATLAGHPITVLAAYGRYEVLEGPDVEGAVAPVARKRGGFQLCVVRNSGELKPVPGKDGSVLVPGFDRPRSRLPNGLGEKGVLST